VWFDFFSDTRHWELEPYFDVDGGRPLALEDTEYVVYVAQPGPVELTVEKHGYDVYWDESHRWRGGEVEKKKFSGDHFTGERACTTSRHDWCMHVVREGRVAGMTSRTSRIARDRASGNRV